MALPIVRDLGHTASFTPRDASAQGRISAESFARPMRLPHEAQPPKPKVEALPPVSAYRGLMMRGIR